MRQPLRDDREVLLLAEAVEADPQAEALGQRDLLLHRLARMHLDVAVALRVGGSEVVLHLLGQQVAAVAGRIDQQVVGGRRDGAVQHRLQRLVAGLAFVEAEVVAEDHEALRPVGHEVGEVRQIDQVALVDFDEAQALSGELVQAGLDQRALAGAARAGQQHVVGGLALHELARVAQQALLLRLDLLEVGQPDRRQVPDRLEPRARAALAVAEGHGGVPVGRRQGLGQHGLQAVQQRIGASQQGIKGVGHDAECRSPPGTFRASGVVNAQASIRIAASNCSVGRRLKPERA